jgi:hypothetical protein
MQKFPDWVYDEIYAYNNKHSLRSNTKGYGDKTHYTCSQNSDTIVPSGRELYQLHFSLRAASPKTFGYTLVYKQNLDHINFSGHDGVNLNDAASFGSFTD